MDQALGLSDKARLYSRIWGLSLSAWWTMRSEPLPSVVKEWSGDTSKEEATSPLKIASIVDRVLIVGRWRPRCIIRAMVLYRLVSEAGYQAELVVGLPDRSETKDGHAWVEIDGHDIGPWPGAGDNVALAHFGPGGSR